jgi:hypothetical protein
LAKGVKGNLCAFLVLWQPRGVIRTLRGAEGAKGLDGMPHIDGIFQLHHFHQMTPAGEHPAQILGNPLPV